jgi:flavin-dependent dehydrogenase
MARLLGLPHPTVLRGIQIEAPFTGQRDRTYVFFHRSLKHGYGWVFPKGSVANVGIGVSSGRGIKSSLLLERFADGLREMGLINPGQLARWGGLIPVSGLREGLFVDDVIFCGDAAGLTHPITGAGIAQAVISGELAGRSAAMTVRTGNREHLAAYEQEVRGRFAGVIGHALSKRKFLMDHWSDPDFRSVCERTWTSFKGYRKRERRRP